MRYEKVDIRPEIEVQRGISRLLQGKVRLWFTYYDHYYHATFGPYKTGRRITAYSSGGKMFSVKALDEGLGFKVISGDGKHSEIYAAGEECRIGDKTFQGE